MISLICTHCQTQLTIDDAFAGGVCRCQHCGTIQTVPAKNATVAAGTTAEVAGGRSLYRTQSRGNDPSSSSTGGSATLEELADVVASSGLSGSGLSGSGLSSGSLRRKKQATRPAAASTATGAAPAPNRTPLLIAMGVALAIAIGFCVYLATRTTTESATHNQNSLPNSVANADSSAAGNPANSAAAPAGSSPQFCGTPLTGSTIVYLLDRGNSAAEIFDALKQATFASIGSLGNDRKFQVVLWDNHTGDVSYPPSEPTFATPDNVTACAKALEDVTAYRQSDIEAPLKKVVAESPDVIVIATAKGFELDDSFVSKVEAITSGSKIKLDTISLRGADCAPLKTLAQNSGGTYAVVTDSALRAAGPP